LARTYGSSLDFDIATQNYASPLMLKKQISPSLTSRLS